MRDVALLQALAVLAEAEMLEIKAVQILAKMEQQIQAAAVVVVQVVIVLQVVVVAAQVL